MTDVSKKVLVLGGDGFCGWPTSLYLSDFGHDVIIVDNLSRRDIDLELGCESLTPISELTERVQAWREVTGYDINFHEIDVARQYDKFLRLVKSFKPDVIIHFAEQRSAPFSMRTSKDRRYTVDNNINATNNVLSAIVDSGRDIHLVHLGTMGVYGYGTAGFELPEGYIDVEILGEQKSIIYPPDPGSIYHMTKTQDAMLFYYYNKNWGMRITDLHQGIVWGTQTAQTIKDKRLLNRFDYDGDYGTVLNRFLMQGVLGYPLTVHGTGGQTRAFIHIQNTVECLRLAVTNPPALGERVKILNQMTETHRLIDLAERISEITGTKIAFVDNPRNEDAENELAVKNTQFLELGLVPLTLEGGLMNEVINIVDKYKDRVDISHIPCTSNWK